MFKQWVILWIFAVSTLFPVPVLAHGEGGESTAPDLHPLLVMAEFVILIIVGYRLASWLAKINKRID